MIALWGLASVVVVVLIAGAALPAWERFDAKRRAPKPLDLPPQARLLRAGSTTTIEWTMSRVSFWLVIRPRGADQPDGLVTGDPRFDEVFVVDASSPDALVVLSPEARRLLLAIHPVHVVVRAATVRVDADLPNAAPLVAAASALAESAGRHASSVLGVGASPYRDGSR